jgi:hypothetical protein
MNKTLVTKEDIVDVANSIGITLTEKELDWALLCYEDAQRQDPSGTWNLVVEDLVYQAVEFRKDKPGDIYAHDHPRYGEDASTDDCFFDREETDHPFPFHTDGDGDDNILLNFIG